MKNSISAMLSLFQILVFSVFALAAARSAADGKFLKCLSVHSKITIPVYTPSNSSYTSVLQLPIKDLRFLNVTTPKPKFIITPVHKSHVQAAVICCRKHGLQIRVRSGGHDFEGLSYTSHVPFVLVDIANLKSIDINLKDGSAWVGAGATVGQLLYQIAEKSQTYGFPAGLCATVGVGGHFSGGAYGNLNRKYGLSADNILDATIVNVDGKILNRKTMGEDLFWAIRGGGGASFGVILSWKIKLVPVPPTVTVFRLLRTIEQGVTDLVYKWQYVANKFPEDLHLRLSIRKLNASPGVNQTVRVSFVALFLGKSEQLLQIMNQSYPELGLQPKDCIEIPWIQSVPYFAGFPPNTTLQVQEMNPFKTYFKGKSDYVPQPISKTGLQGIWKALLEVNNTAMAFIPHGGRMSKIPETEIPFPHRSDKMYAVEYFTSWPDAGSEAANMNVGWTRKLYNYMTPHVSKSPRAQYLNHRDLDLGQVKVGTATYAQAKVWGIKYFKNNFDRLVKVKSKVDPQNFFRNEQSIPPVPF
ncbi:hypothetical protein Sjap_024704 [Stephania japonica]|uniref:FAD-binding PCMH-type domain-containing protein n=1 Tax=Stephania japonica TaxID=461633 RepID=A0AAP0HNZ3_9MAGN